ncbi:hypothetical protein BSKO_07598 [Bryopsis sp. KO-2023]|nr:hypothetical protein BSKO_07598 [Bryopsis sp. KO-2023]
MLAQTGSSVFLTPLRPAARRSLVAPRAAWKQDDGSNSSDERRKLHELMAAPMAAAVAAALISGSVLPEEAFAARSGGRVGGSAFRSAPRQSARTAPAAGGTTIQNNYYAAPPVFGGFGFPGFGGFSIMPTFGVPIGFGFGGIFSIFITLFVLSAVVNTVRSIQENTVDKKRRDDFNDFD